MYDAGIAQSCVVFSKRTTAKGCVSQSKIWVIKEVKEVGTKLKGIFVLERESLRHEEIPILLEWSADFRDVAAEVAKDGAHMRSGSGAADGEGLISRTSEVV